MSDKKEKKISQKNINKFNCMKFDLSKNQENLNSQSSRIRWGSNRMTMFDGEEAINKKNNPDPNSNENYRKFKVISQNVVNVNKPSEDKIEKKNNIEFENKSEISEVSVPTGLNEADQKNFIYTKKSISIISKPEPSLIETEKEIESSGKGSGDPLWEDEEEQQEHSEEGEFIDKSEEDSSDIRQINPLNDNGAYGCEEENFVHSASSEINITHSKITISSQDSLPSFSVQDPDKKSDRSIIQKGKFEESASRIKRNKEILKSNKQQNLKDGNLDGNYKIKNYNILYDKILLKH
jgi:hypothetical protein